MTPLKTDPPMNKLLVALFSGAFALGSVAATADDQDKKLAAYKMGKDSQRLHDLQAQEAKAQDNPPATPEESKEIKEAAAKARAAYARMKPEEKAMYKKGMRAQMQLDLPAQQAQRPRAVEAPPLGWWPLIKKKEGAPAIDMRPISTLNTAQMQVARAKARERWEGMTPEEQAKAKETAAAKKGEEFTALDEMASRTPAGTPLIGDVDRPSREPMPPKAQ